MNGGDTAAATNAATDEALPSHSGTGRSAAPQARAERRRARVVGDGRETDQAVAEETARRQGRLRNGGADCGQGRRARRAVTIGQNGSDAKTCASAVTAATGADRTSRTFAAVARAQADRCPAGSARHDAGSRAPRAWGFPAPRACRWPELRAGHYRQGKNRRRIRARRVASRGAAMAGFTGIPQPGGRIRGSPYRPWRRGRALCADQARADLKWSHD